METGDEFKTFIASDLEDDPGLRSVFVECGCGHLLAIVESGKFPALKVGVASKLRDSTGLAAGTGRPKLLDTRRDDPTDIRMAPKIPIETTVT